MNETIQRYKKNLYEMRHAGSLQWEMFETLNFLLDKAAKSKVNAEPQGEKADGDTVEDIRERMNRLMDAVPDGLLRKAAFVHGYGSVDMMKRACEVLAPFFERRMRERCAKQCESWTHYPYGGEPARQEWKACCEMLAKNIRALKVDGE